MKYLFSILLVIASIGTVDTNWFLSLSFILVVLFLNVKEIIIFFNEILETE